MLLSRYLFRQETMAVVMITLVIAGAIWFSQSLRLLDIVVQGGAPMIAFFEMMWLILPSFLVPILPITLFLGLLFVMHKLIQDQEWVVMQGVGLSFWQLARPALLLAFVVMLLHSALAIEIAPAMQRDLRFQRQLVQTDYAGAFLRSGTFNAIGSNMTIYVKERKGSSEFNGILIHDTRDPRFEITLTAQQGYLVTGEGAPRLVIQNGTRQERNSETRKINWLVFDQYVVDLAMLKQAQEDVFVKPYERPMKELLSPPSDITPKQKIEFIAEGHERISFPLYNIAFSMIAFVIVMGGEFSRRGRPARYIIGILGVVGLQALALTLATLSAENLQLVPLMYAAPLLVGVACIAWLSRLHKGRGSHHAQAR